MSAPLTVGEPDLATVIGWLADVPDPEIPVVSIRDLGIVRDVRWTGPNASRELCVALTPTYAGCPAMRAIAEDVVACLHARGIANVRVETRLSPAWTTDWLTAQAREKLRAYGISPPLPRSAIDVATETADLDLVSLLGEIVEAAACPRCGSRDVALVSRFASTPCKALYTCARCAEPFDHFKVH